MKSHKSESAVSSNVQFYEVGVGQTHYYNNESVDASFHRIETFI